MTRNISFCFLCITEELRYICFKFSAAILAAILEKMQLLNCLYLFVNIWTSGSLLHMNRHFICICIWNRTDTLDSNFWRPSWPPSWKIGKYCYLFLQIWYFCPLFSYESTLSLSLYMKAELRYIRFKSSVAILAAILEKYATVVIDFYIFELYVL